MLIKILIQIFFDLEFLIKISNILLLLLFLFTIINKCFILIFITINNLPIKFKRNKKKKFFFFSI